MWVSCIAPGTVDTPSVQRITSSYDDPDAARQAMEDELQAGILHVNSQGGAEVDVPFAGPKAAGYGPHEEGRAAVHFSTEQVTVYQDA